jgi:RNA polymerase sigma-70 factor, ECF subfamily
VTTLRKQHDASFDDLFTCEFDRCARAARRITGNAELSRDIAAEAFARAWARWPTLREQRPGAWVITVTVNLAIDALRKRVVTTTCPIATRSPEDLAVARCTVDSALQELPARQRMALVLRYLADYPEDEIAAVLGVSRGTVKVHLHRGIAGLRRVLGSSQAED